MRYGKLENGNVEYAGKVIRLDDGSVVVAPKEADLLAAHYLPVVDEKPTTDDAHYAAPTGWVEQDGAVRRIYEIREKPPRPPRRFDPYRLQEALIREGVWSRVRAWLQSDQDNWDRWLKAPDIDEDEPLFAAAVEAAKTGFGWTDEKIESVLSRALA